MTFVADFPGAIVVEAKQYGYPKGAHNNHAKAWGLHTPEEPPDDNPSTPYYFHNLTDRRASTTYFVAWTGLVFQCVPEDEGAYGQGRDGVPGHFDWEDPGVNLNLQSWSIEIEGYASTIHLTMPRGSPQWVSLVRLMAHRCRARGVPPERTFGHYQVSVQRSDPGQLDIAALVADVRALLGGEEEVDMFRARLPNGGQYLITGDGKKRALTNVAAQVYDRAGVKGVPFSETEAAEFPDYSDPAVAHIDYAALAKAVNDDAARRRKDWA